MVANSSVASGSSWAGALPQSHFIQRDSRIRAPASDPPLRNRPLIQLNNTVCALTATALAFMAVDSGSGSRMSRAGPSHQILDPDGAICHEQLARLKARRQAMIAVHGFDRTEDSRLAGGKLSLVTANGLELDLQGWSDVGHNVTGCLGQVQSMQGDREAQLVADRMGGEAVEGLLPLGQPAIEDGCVGDQHGLIVIG